jgi:peroxiredoxin
MKKIVLIALACLPAAAFAQAGQFIIEGSFGSYNAPAKIYLQYHAKDKEITDSATMVNGKFKFAGQAEIDPVEAILAFNAKGDGFKYDDLKRVFLENGTITVTCADKLKKAVAGGTSANVDNEKLNTGLAAVNAAWDDLSTKETAASGQEKQSPEFQKNIYKLMEETEQRQDLIYQNFIAKNPDSYIGLFTLDRYAYGGDYREIAPLFNGLSARLKQTSLGRHLAGRLPHIKAIALGAIAPEFTEADTSGKMISLSSFRGKYVLIDFWASWCNPCRAENPNVVKAFNLYKGKNFTVIGVSLDGPGEKNNWLAAIRKDGLPWTQVSDLNSWWDKAAVLYLVKGIPQNFLLDPDGKIIAKNLRSEDLENKLAEVLAKR